jgi:predicted DNA-binding WGR domain protein
MTATLFRTDPSRNIRRFYIMDVRPDLFGAWCFIREWGRIGRAGQMRADPFTTEQEAWTALERQSRRKARRGYQSAKPDEPSSWRSRGEMIGQQISNRRPIRLGFDFGAESGGKQTGEFGVVAGMAQGSMTDDQGPPFFGCPQGRLSFL